MENAVMQVSRYLDRIEAPLSCCKHRLLMVAFSRALRRHAARLNRLEFVGGSDELSGRLTADMRTAQVDARLDLENVVRKLSQRNSAVLLLRAAGFEWKEIASMLGSSAAAVKNGFWREIARLRTTAGLRPDV
jgi:DNA-binding NarL/FixJ family response regulator